MASFSSSRMKRWFPILILLLLALTVRLLWLQHNLYNQGRFYGYSVTSAMIGEAYKETNKVGVVDTELAQRYAQVRNETGRLIDPEEFGGRVELKNIKPQYDIEIGLGMLMGMIWKLTGHSRFVYVQLLQILIDVICVLLLYLAVHWLFKDRRFALFAVLLYALFPYQIDLVTFPAPYVWPVFLVVTITFLLAYITKRKRLCEVVGVFLLAGVSIGLVAMIRSTVVLLGVFIGLLSLVWNPYLSDKRRIWLLVAIIAGQALVMLPLVLHNKATFGAPFPTRGTFWHTVYTGFGAHDNPWGIRNDDQATIERVKRAYPNISYATPEYENVLKKWSLRIIFSHPLWYAGVLISRAALFVLPDPSAKTSWPIVGLVMLGIIGAYRVIASGHFSKADKLAVFYALSLPSVHFPIFIIPIYIPERVYVQASYVALLTLSVAAFRSPGTKTA